MGIVNGASLASVRAGGRKRRWEISEKEKRTIEGRARETEKRAKNGEEREAVLAVVKRPYVRTFYKRYERSSERINAGIPSSECVSIDRDPRRRDIMRFRASTR